MVFDGSGAESIRADVLVADGKIIHVGTIDRCDAERTIDASGKIVTPGFIDPHAHGEPRRTPGFANFLRMGVTTIVLGQDGRSSGGKPLREWQQAVARGRFAPNIATMVGHGTVRRLSGIGLSSDPTDKQLQVMAAMVDDAMAAGAFGLSLGLEYEPGRFANATELLRVAEPVAKHGGLVMSHMRSEDEDRVCDAVRELLAQCQAAGCAAHVSHLKIVHGKGEGRARQVLQLLGAARARGQRVTADLYPYAASYTGIGIVFPAWARPPNDYATVVRERRAELGAFLRDRVAKRNGPEAVLIGSGRWAGRTLAVISKELGTPMEQVLIDEFGPSGASAAHFVMDAEVMRLLLSAEHVMVGSDGSPTMRHPRGHGAFARVIREFVAERELLTLPQAIHKMSGLAAATLGLDRQSQPRGLLREGFAADVLVFDPALVRDRATYEAPYERATGIDTVLVNGELVVDDGELTKLRPGRLLYRDR